MKKLPVLCPQEYDGMDMRAVPCNKCPTGWDKKLKRCTIDTGAAHLPDEKVIPTCPIQDRCQHQLQSKNGPCQVRTKGLICESALIEGGMSPHEASDHPLSFHAMMMATEEELAESDSLEA